MGLFLFVTCFPVFLSLFSDLPFLADAYFLYFFPFGK